MKRGELYRFAHPTRRDPKRFRVFVVVSRQVLIDSRFSTAMCAPVYTAYDGLATQVPVGTGEGLKHDSSIHCDEVVSLPKSVLTDYIGSLSPQKTDLLNPTAPCASCSIYPTERWSPLWCDRRYDGIA